MRLNIDNVTVQDFDVNTDVAITFSIASITDIDKERTGFTKTIKVPITPETRGIFGFPEDVHSITFFNQEDHKAIIDDDDVILIAGSAVLIKSETNVLGAGYYNINIIGAGKKWAVDAATRMMSDVNIHFGQIFSEQAIVNSWQGQNALLRWLPIVRAPFSYVENRETITRPMNMWDYHPFFNAKIVFLQIFKDAGYEVQSQFISSGGLDELYFSGFLNRSDVEEQKKEWDFFAGRFQHVELPNSTNPIKIGIDSSSVQDISIVDTSDPNASISIMEDYEEVIRYVDEAFENSGIVRSGVFVKRECYFECPKDVTMGFRITVKYSTQVKYRDLNADPTPNPPLKGVAFYYSKIRYGDRQGVDIQRTIGVASLIGSEIEPTREAYGVRHFKVDGNFIAETPSYNGQDWYLLVRKTAVGVSPVDKVYRITDRYTVISISTAGYNPEWQLSVMRGYRTIGTRINLFEALNEITPEVTFDIVAQRIPAGKYYFDQLIFEKSISDPTPINFIYGVGTNITPIFPLTGIGVGEEITTELVMSKQVNQSTFLRAVKQMFNFNLYTDAFKNIVFVEPRDDFYSGPIIDWSDKIDLSKPIVIEELGADIGRIFSVGYGEPDYTVEKFNEDNNTTLGTFNEKILNLFAKPETDTHENEMFHPSIVRPGAYPQASSIKLLHANDSDNELVANPDTRIVKYLGTEQLPTGETLEFPAETTQYPVVAFSSDGVNLCFEDRNGVTGLHQYYDKNIRMYNKSKRITAHLHLKSVDIEPFAKLNPLKQDFRAKFKLKIDEEYVFCNLESIVDFKNGERSTKCVFVKRVV